MLTYEFYCPDCSATFDLQRPIDDRDLPAPCPDCRTENASRLLSTFNALGSSGPIGSGCGSCVPSVSGCSSCASSR